MSEAQNLPQTVPVDEAMVIDYLLSNRDFFVHHGDLLTELRIPHDSGAAVSLVERQIGVYREKSLRLEKQLKELLKVARENERLGHLLHQFSVSLMRTQSTAAVLDLTRITVKRDFRADQVAVQLFDNDATVDDMFADMSASRNVVCGMLSARKRALLFDHPDEAASMALILLHAEGNNMGVMALASKDKNSFHPSKGILFLSQLGDLVSHRLLTVR